MFLVGGARVVLAALGTAAVMAVALPAEAKVGGPFDVLTPEGEIRTVEGDIAERFWAEWGRLYTELQSNCLSCDSAEQAAEVHQDVYVEHWRDHGGQPSAYLIRPHAVSDHAWSEAYAFYPATDEGRAYFVDLGGTGKKSARWDWWSVASPEMESIVLGARSTQDEGNGVVEWALIALSIAAFSAAIAWSVARRPVRR